MTLTSFSTPKTPAERAQYYIHISSRYTEPGMDRIKRHLEYCDAPGAYSSKRAVTGVVLATALLFAKAGKEIGKKIEELLVEDKTEGDLGGLIGGGTGFILGVCAGGYAYLNFVESMDNYKKWLDLRLDHTVKAATTYSYSNDSILKNYCCPLTCCIMDIPAYSPSGTLYDFDFLSHCPRDGNNLIKDPLNNPPFDENLIKEQWEMGFFIKKRMQFLIKKDLETKNLPSQLKKSLEDQLSHITKATIQHYEYARNRVEDRRKNKIVSATEYKKELQEFENLFGIDENQELDWGLDWEQILKERFKAFHPGAKVI